MFADNHKGAADAYLEWLEQGADSPPTNGDVVRYEKIDEDVLRHLAEFMYQKGFDAARS